MPLDIKNQRVEMLVKQFREDAALLNNAQIGTTQLIMVEGVSIVYVFKIRHV